jgi:hypothetical protein
LECCVPPIQHVPQGSYFCVDCDPNGSATLIEQYFDRMEERCADAMAETDGKDPMFFLQTLWGEDLDDNQENWNPDEHIPAKDGRVPQSELARLLDLQQHLGGAPWATGTPCTFDHCGEVVALWLRARSHKRYRRRIGMLVGAGMTMSGRERSTSR